jgi:hypothetical protein
MRILMIYPSCADFVFLELVAQVGELESVWKNIVLRPGNHINSSFVVVPS